MRWLRVLLAMVLLASTGATGGAAAGVSPAHGDSYVAGELIVGLEPGANPGAVASALSGRVDRALLGGNGFVLSIPGNPRAMAAVAAAMPGVTYAEPNWIRTLHDHSGPDKPTDTDFGIKWDLHNEGTLTVGSDTATHGADINWLVAYDTLKGQALADTVIAILDTGIDASHPDLDQKLVGGWDFIGNDPTPEDGYGHGTHVAGIAAAETNNSLGTAGVGFHLSIKIMAIKVCSDSGSCPSSAIANGITWAADNGAKVVNMSLGGTSISTAEQNAINYAHGQGVLMVASAGNSNVSTQNFPAAYEPVMAIAATNWDDGKASYSNFGASWVDLAAPGGQMSSYGDIRGIYSTMPTYNVYLTSCQVFGLLSPCYSQNYDQLQGTSMAAPQVAGAAALLFAMGVTDPTAVRNFMQDNANPISGTGTLWANGRLDIGAAVAAAGGVEPPPPPPPAETGTVSGTVTATGGGAISGATVTVEGTGKSATTDGSGAYSIGEVPVGTYTVSASAEGYESGSVPGVEVASGGTTTVDFELVAEEQPPPPPPPPEGTIHVGGLSGIAVNNGSTWTANVTILVRDSNAEPVAGVTVTGDWSNGATGSSTCVTDSSGLCTVSKPSILKRVGSVTFTVTDLVHESLVYHEGSNVVTSIVVSKN